MWTKVNLVNLRHTLVIQRSSFVLALVLWYNIKIFSKTSNPTTYKTHASTNGRKPRYFRKKITNYYDYSLTYLDVLNLLPYNFTLIVGHPLYITLWHISEGTLVTKSTSYSASSSNLVLLVFMPHFSYCKQHRKLVMTKLKKNKNLSVLPLPSLVTHVTLCCLLLCCCQYFMFLYLHTISKNKTKLLSYYRTFAGEITLTTFQIYIIYNKLKQTLN